MSDRDDEVEVNFQLGLGALVNVLVSEHKKGVTARVAYDEIPALLVPNTSELTPADVFIRDLRQAMGQKA